MAGYQIQLLPLPSFGSSLGYQLPEHLVPSAQAYFLNLSQPYKNVCTQQIVKVVLSYKFMGLQVVRHTKTRKDN